jgi:hypothetical protein
MPVSGKRIALKQDVEALSRKLQNMINQAAGGQQAAIASPSGGSVQDTECRAAVNQILDALRAIGRIGT